MSRHEVTAAGGRCVGVGSQVRFEDRTWQVTGVVDGRVYLAAEDGATGCVLAARLVAADGFEVLGQAAPQVPAAADMRQVYIRLSDGLLHQIPWTEHAHALRPFDDAMRRRTGQILAARSGPPGHPAPSSNARGPKAGDPADGQGLTDTLAPGGAAVAPVPDGPARAGAFAVWDAQAQAEQW